MLRYEGAVYRPPSEARSLIIQATLGCSHNKCTFCSMYKDKPFRARAFEDVENDLRYARSMYSHVRRIFLADGDALILSFEKLSRILLCIKELFPECERIGIYGTSKSINIKTLEELVELKKLGLGIIYLGLESGNEEILRRIQKGETAEDIVKAGKKVKESEILLSVTAISGLGSQELKDEHAIDTAKALSAMKPDFIGFLALMVEREAELYKDVLNSNFKLLTPIEIVEEMILFLKNIDSEGSVFRSNHASNYFSLYGDLNKDVPSMLAELEEVLKDDALLKAECFRRL
ncbi:MAG: radical SAM protein [Proteocatella sp.]